MATVVTVKDLLDKAQLVNIQFLEFSGTLRDTDEVHESDNIGIQVAESHDEDRIEVRFRVTMTHEKADLLLVVATRYSFAEPVQIDPATIQEFIEKIAVMAAFPFIREGIASLASRLDLEPATLGLLRQGNFSMGNVQPD